MAKEKIIKKVLGSKPNAADEAKALEWKTNTKDFKDGGFFKKGEKFAGHFSGNIQSSVAAEGKTVLGAMGGHAVRGATFGGLAGGTIEAAQGGSF